MIRNGWQCLRSWKAAKSRYGLVLVMMIGCVSCATPVVQHGLPFAPRIPSIAVMPPVIPMPRQNIFHTVAPGETLWRISKMYDVPENAIIRANRLASQPVLRKGSRILVPNAAPVQPVISLYPSRRWTHIIIHHSATEEGDSLLFDRVHLDKGWDGVGYHFVIDNGTKGRVDGQIEVSPRWLKQIPGAHCKADGMNERAIGICLVGNFNDDVPSASQMAALVTLVKRLQEYYQIPLNQIKGHGQVSGAKTDCPGRRFPWDVFKRSLK